MPVEWRFLPSHSGVASFAQVLRERLCQPSRSKTVGRMEFITDVQRGGREYSSFASLFCCDRCLTASTISLRGDHSSLRRGAVSSDRRTSCTLAFARVIGSRDGMAEDLALPREQQIARTKTRLLRQLKAAPLSTWPQAVVNCLEMLQSIGVCERSMLTAMLHPLIEDESLDRRGRTGALVRSKEVQVATADAQIRSPGIAGDSSTLRGSGVQRSASEQTLSPEVRRIRSFINRHFRERLSLRELAAGVGRNTQYLSALFHRQTGSTVHTYLTTVRMKHAARLLRRSEKVEAVMLLVGYRSKKNFYHQFYNSFGMTPGSYKARHSARHISAVEQGQGVT